MAEQRVQKVLADQGICSRREAERLIAAGKVKVNGHPVGLGDKMDPDYDKVAIDGQTVRIVRKRQYTYIMLHKPRGFLTTRSDDRGRKTVMDLVSDVPAMLRPVGRLDKDSEGLLLMTDDGAFINLLTHPSGGVGKLYHPDVLRRGTGRRRQDPALRDPCCRGRAGPHRAGDHPARGPQPPDPPYVLGRRPAGRPPAPYCRRPGQAGHAAAGRIP